MNWTYTGLWDQRGYGQGAMVEGAQQCYWKTTLSLTDHENYRRFLKTGKISFCVILKKEYMGNYRLFVYYNFFKKNKNIVVPSWHLLGLFLLFTFFNTVKKKNKMSMSESTFLNYTQKKKLLRNIQIFHNWYHFPCLIWMT